jgi:hypothetical protein
MFCGTMRFQDDNYLIFNLFKFLVCDSVTSDLNHASPEMFY